jgi:hypothetical protein
VLFDSKPPYLRFLEWTKDGRPVFFNRRHESIHPVPKPVRDVEAPEEWLLRFVDPAESGTTTPSEAPPPVAETAPRRASPPVEFPRPRGASAWPDAVHRAAAFAETRSASRDRFVRIHQEPRRSRGPPRARSP